jgi:hypothetical protein
LSTLGRKPDWSELEKYQATITYDQFAHLLNDAYCTSEYHPDLIKVEPEAARILTATGTQNYFVLRFAKSDADETSLPPYHYKTENVASVGTSGYAFARVRAGDYDGARRVAGRRRPSIYREYVEGVVEGVFAYFKKTRYRQLPFQRGHGSTQIIHRHV